MNNETMGFQIKHLSTADKLFAGMKGFLQGII